MPVGGAGVITRAASLARVPWDLDGSEGWRAALSVTRGPCLLLDPSQGNSTVAPAPGPSLLSDPPHLPSVFTCQLLSPHLDFCTVGSFIRTVVFTWFPPRTPTSPGDPCLRKGYGSLWNTPCLLWRPCQRIPSWVLKEAEPQQQADGLSAPAQVRGQETSPTPQHTE